MIELEIVVYAWVWLRLWDCGETTRFFMISLASRFKSQEPQIHDERWIIIVHGGFPLPHPPCLWCTVLFCLSEMLSTKKSKVRFTDYRLFTLRLCTTSIVKTPNAVAAVLLTVDSRLNSGKQKLLVQTNTQHPTPTSDRGIGNHQPFCRVSTLCRV